MYVDGGQQKWAVRNHPGATAANPWDDTAFWGGSGKPPAGVPMSGSMLWNSDGAGGYAEETDTGSYLPATGVAEIPGGAAANGGGAHAWDMDWSWGSEVVPLEYPGFEVTVVDLGGGAYDVIMTPAIHQNTIPSSTMYFEGALTDAGGGIYTGTIDMTSGGFYAAGGFDVYAEEGGTAYVTGSTWPIGSSHDAYSAAGPWGSWWDPDVPDWDKYSLELTTDHWYLRYTPTGESPMSGAMDWENMYAAETDLGTQDGGHDGSAAHGGGVGAWDWDCGWGVEVIPLELPRFQASITDLGGGQYRVELTPAGLTTVWVDDDYCDGCANDGHTWGYDAFDNIQDGIDAVEGSTVNVAAGTYEEQLSITTDLTLIGAGQGNTIITSPTTLDVMFTTALGNNPDRRPIVYVGSDATVTIQDLTVDGLGRGNANSQFQGISFFNAGGAVDNVHITRVRNGGLAGPLTGAQHGVSLTAFNDDGSPRSINMTDCTIDDIQKNAVALFGPALSVNVSDNVITGAGATTITAQNGIQLGAGAAGIISGNTITGIGYTGPSWAATSILLFGGTGTTVSGNTITMSGSNGGDFGLNAQGGADNLTVSGNTFDGVAYGVIVLDGSGLVVTGNDMVNIYYEGIFLYGPVSGATITNNSIPGAGDAAFFVWDSDGSGTFATHTIEHNEFSGSAWANAGAIDIAFAAPPTTGTLDLSANYWGSNDSAAVAATIYGTSAIDFSPILDNGDTDGGAVGFVPDLTVVTVHQEGAQTSSLIQEGMDTVVGSTVNVALGAYDETVAIGTDFNGGTITGELGSMPLVTGGMTLAGGLTGVTVENLHFTGVGASNTIIRMLGGVSGLTLDNCIIDGELISGRHGFGGGQLEGDATITNCEFKDVLGWALFESRSGSGGGGSPLNMIIFSNNNIHNCNGSVVFRGDETNPPTSYTESVTISGNTWQTIGGNKGEQGQHWAAFEVNRAKDVDVFNNSVDNVSEGEWDEGQAAQLWSITDLDVHHNSFTNCFQGILIGYVDDVTVGSINNNTISGNTQYGLLVVAGATVGPLDAEFNYWGDDTGPFDAAGIYEAESNTCYDPAIMVNSDGLGNEVSDLNVDYCPWLTTEDADFDGVANVSDNCPGTPNGPVLGTCISGNIGQYCLSLFNCGLGGFCSLNQEDTDQDDMGDPCDDDIDGDDILNDEDICPVDYDPGQEDTYPQPSGNICGDACECEGNFDNDLDVDGYDTTTFLADLGRFSLNNPCTALDPCNGDFDCDGDVDGPDTTRFLEDLGRFSFNKPCPQNCQTGDWCTY